MELTMADMYGLLGIAFLNIQSYQFLQAQRRRSWRLGLQSYPFLQAERQQFGMAIIQSYQSPLLEHQPLGDMRMTELLHQDANPRNGDQSQGGHRQDMDQVNQAKYKRLKVSATCHFLYLLDNP